MAIREDRERASRGQEQEGGTRVHPSIHRESRAIKVESERERGLVFFGRKAAMTNGMDGRREEPHKRCASYSTLTLGSGKVRVGPRHRRTILSVLPAPFAEVGHRFFPGTAGVVTSFLLSSSPSPPGPTAVQYLQMEAAREEKSSLPQRSRSPSERNTFLWCDRRSRLGRRRARAGDDGICWTTRANCSGRFFTRIRSQDLPTRRGRRARKKDDDGKEEWEGKGRGIGAGIPQFCRNSFCF